MAQQASTHTYVGALGVNRKDADVVRLVVRRVVDGKLACERTILRSAERRDGVIRGCNHATCQPRGAGWGCYHSNLIERISRAVGSRTVELAQSGQAVVAGCHEHDLGISHP